jgi:HlyD family secretion protein
MRQTKQKEVKIMSPKYQQFHTLPRRPTRKRATSTSEVHQETAFKSDEPHSVSEFGHDNIADRLASSDPDSKIENLAVGISPRSQRSQSKNTDQMTASGKLFARVLGHGKTPRVERERSQWPILLLTTCVLFLILLVPYFLLRPSTSTYMLRQFTAATVSRSDIEESVSSAGSFMPKDTAELSAKLTATVQRVQVKEGDEVSTGQALANLVAQELDGELRRAEAARADAEDRYAQLQLQLNQEKRVARIRLQAAQIAVSERSKALAYVRALYAVGGEAKSNVDVAEGKLRTAESELVNASQDLNDLRESQQIKVSRAKRERDQTRSEIQRMERQRQALTIRAPFNGRVIGVHVRSGQDVQLGTKLLTLADISQLMVEGRVDADLAAQVQPGQAVRILVPDRIFRGSVFRVAPLANTSSNGATVKVEVRILDELKPSLSVPKLYSDVGLEITVSRKTNVLTLPRGAYLATGDQQIVYVINIDGQGAVRKQVVFGSSSADSVEVRSGLVSGERVITSSVEAFKDREVIQVSPSGELK